MSENYRQSETNVAFNNKFQLNLLQSELDQLLQKCISITKYKLHFLK